MYRGYRLSSRVVPALFARASMRLSMRLVGYGRHHHAASRRRLCANLPQGLQFRGLCAQPGPPASWAAQVKAADSGDPRAQCDCGWAHHTGAVPGAQGVRDLRAAIELYELSAWQGYSPAASLLADLYFYGSEPATAGEVDLCSVPVNWTKARKWLRQVVQLTDASQPADAYVRAKALQRLGIIECKTESYGNSEHTRSQELFKESLALCTEHLGGNWAFLLSHDPPGLWEHLEEESQLLERLGQYQPLLRRYTHAVRDTESSDSSWNLALQTEALDLTDHLDFSELGAWGVTFLPGFLRIFQHDAVRQAMQGAAAETDEQVELPKVSASSKLYSYNCLY
jgi:hypothetical protein